MILGEYIKQPADRTDYDIDFTDWLIPGDSIADVSAQATPDTIRIDSIQNSTPRVKTWLSNGLDGVKYRISITITTHGGRVKQVEFNVKVKDY
ncbi:hypothetical protein [Desulfovibrio inopinatus]|uniref:phage fiber-tail adaptor protein n=1 Tax=Desulfovibrio inopinatus TaxID=102109 RepID=UPI0003FADA03|nr:hypothetical protein [Desulfovibrio inopinatus]